MSVGNRFALVVGLLMSASCSSPNPNYLGHQDLATSRDLSTAGGPPAPDLSSPDAHDLAVDDLAHHAHDLSGEDFHHPDHDLAHHEEDLAHAASDLASVDSGTHTCVGFGGGCLTGVSCGSGCCGSGEWCDSGTCRCGNDVACTGLNHCGGATLGGGLGCGTTCCGALGGTLCPL